MPLRRIKFDQLDSAVLIALFDEFMDDGEMNVQPEKLFKRFNSGVPLNAIKLALEDLATGNFVVRVTRSVRVPASHGISSVISGQTVKEESPTGEYKITRSGLEKVQKYADGYVSEIRTEYLSNIQVPASDRAVSIKHNQPYDETVSALDELIAAAPTNNEFGELIADAEERIAIQSEWKSLREWLNSPKVYIDSVRPIAERLKRIGERLGDAVLGALAIKIVEGLAQILPNLF